MTDREKSVWVLLLSIAGIVLVVSFCAWRFPAMVREKVTLDTARANVEATMVAESQSSDQLARSKADAADLNEQARKKRQELAAASFTPRLESKIPDFIEQLQGVFSREGLKMTDMTYKQKTREKEFVTLPFQMRFQAPYRVFKEFLFSLETFQDALRIDRLEILKLDDEQHQVNFSVSCSMRFRAGS